MMRIRHHTFSGFSLSALAFVASCVFCASADAAPSATPARHTISWDARSLKIDGHRLVVWAGEFHPFRQPSPDLWRDILQKMKALGFNTVTYYVPWGFYTSEPGVYDFSGVRDIDRALTLAEEVGLYVIIRPGPYANAELTRGGFPGWLMNVRGKARTDAPDYLAAADEWLTRIDRILARHQLTNGGGSIIAYQIENELLETTPSHARYMRHLYDKVRADGITVPIFHNDIGRNGYWVPKGANVPETVEGPNDLYAWDSYPGGSCRYDATPGTPNKAPDFGWYGAGGARGGSSASPHTPGFTSEFGGGWFDYWGSNGNYACIAERIGGGYERVFYGTNLANGLTLESFYMAVGGTNWGWQAGPVVFTSYDYGAAISEARVLRPKAQVLKQLGEFVQAAGTDLAGMTKGEILHTADGRVKIYRNLNPDSGAQLLVAMHDPSNALAPEVFSFDLASSGGRYRVPQTGTLRLDGQDAKLLLADFALERQHLVYATSELQTALQLAKADVALFYGRDGEDGEIVLRYAKAPHVEVLQGSVAQSFDASRGDLRLNFVHRGLAEVKISGGGRPDLLLILADEKTAQSFWRLDAGNLPVLVRGPALVRDAALKGGTLALTGDTEGASPLEVWCDAAMLSWNGTDVAARATPAGSLAANEDLAGAAPVALPDLTRSLWRRRMGSPEAARDFDDGAWPRAEAQTTAGISRRPEGQPVLTMDDYGFHNGDVWYRGRYEGNGASNRLELTYGGGGVGMLQLWVDGRFIGENELPGGADRPQTTGTAVFALPAWAVAPGPHVIAAMVRNDGHNWDLTADDVFKEGRGLISASLARPAGARYEVPIAWKIHGAGEKLADTARGPLNNGGLSGEAQGWTLPGFPDGAWQKSSLTAAPPAPGTYWLRTGFDLDLPAGHDVQLGLVFGRSDAVRSDGKYRVLIFVNGWNMGQFVAHVGPQRTFVIPEGIVNGHGHNTLALAVTTDGASENTPEPVRLTVMRAARGGVSVKPPAAPDYRALFGSQN